MARCFICFLAGIVLLASCQKKEDPIPEEEKTSPTSYGKASMHLHIFIGEEEVQSYGEASIPQFAERKMSVELAQFYLYGFEMVAVDNRIVPLKDTVLLKVIGNTSYDLPKIPIGKYKSIRFKVGISDSSRKAEVSQAFGGVLNQAEMWFGAKAVPESYIFANFKGAIDTATVPNENHPRIAFDYQLGGYQDIQVIMPEVPAGQEFTIKSSAAEYLHVYADMNRLLNGVKLNDSRQLVVQSHSKNSSIMAEKIAFNISQMFKYE